MTEVQTKDIETIAYVVHNPKEDFVLEDVVLDEMRDDEVLVDMKFSGICHTVRPFLPRQSHQFRSHLHCATGPRLPTRRHQNLRLPSHLWA